LYTALNGVEMIDGEIDAEFRQSFEQAMDDDFNTPVAISVLFKIATELNKAKKRNDEVKAAELAGALKKLGGLLGMLQANPRDWLQGKASVFGEAYQLTIPIQFNVVELTEEYIDQQIQLRLEAKQNKNWSKADEIRDGLKQLRIILEDRPDGTTDWRRDN